MKVDLNDYITEEQVEYVYKFIYHWNFKDNGYIRNDSDIQKLTAVEKIAILNARKKNIVKEFNEKEKEWFILGRKEKRKIKKSRISKEDFFIKLWNKSL